MFTKEEANFLLEAVFEKSVQTNLGQLVNGLKPSEMVNTVIAKLKDIIAPVEVKTEAPQVSEAPSESIDVTPTPIV